MSLDQIGLWAGVILTLMVFSYILGDNFLYRLAVYIFVGVAVGLSTLIAIQNAIVPWLQSTLLAPNADVVQRLFGVSPLVLGALLLLKLSPRFAKLGNLALAFILGIGTAVAVVGAVGGTLVPLLTATADESVSSPADGVVILIGVITTLTYFMYVGRRIPGQTETTGRRGPLVQLLSTVGKGFIVITLGALYGGAILTSLTIFSERAAAIIARITGG